MKHALLDRKTGFTLIEICVVVVILAIVSATILPEFTGSRDSAQVRAAARELAMVFRLAASRAITTGLEQRVRLDEENSKFWIESRQTDTDAASFVRVDDGPRSSGSLPDGYRLQLRPHGKNYEHQKRLRFREKQRGRRMISFFPDGTCEGKELQLRNEVGHVVTLRLHHATSRLDIAVSRELKAT